MKKTIICIDRDGTLIYDSKEHFFLGKDDAWESEIKLLPHVIDGLKALNGFMKYAGTLFVRLKIWGRILTAIFCVRTPPLLM